TTHEVSMVTDGQEYYFDPIGLHVQPGDTVRWVIESGSHSSTAYGDRIPEGAEAWDSGILQEQGATFEYTFEQEGTYDYFCIPHERLGMVARIVCGQPGGPAEEGEIPNKGQVATGTVPDSQTIVDQGSLSYPYQPGGDGGGDGGDGGGGDGGNGGGNGGNGGDSRLPISLRLVGWAGVAVLLFSLIQAYLFLRYGGEQKEAE
ncbi:MAG: plastocyanin/azurin family copper-binding protein, partial [Halobacteria archaeon]|nr:plastocyanin/azurin family copper-binding protein [Halobacteria archaeon]